MVVGQEREDWLRPFNLGSLIPEAWRNGCGETRTVAARSDEMGLLWRISIAEITEDAGFSRFDGFDRTAVLLRGVGLILCDTCSERKFDRIGGVQRFFGELDINASIGTSHARLWNVMTRRSAVNADVVVDWIEGGRTLDIEEGALFVAAGEIEIKTASRSLRLRGGDGLAIEVPTAMQLRSDSGPSLVVLTSIKLTSRLESRELATRRAAKDLGRLRPTID